METIFGLQRLKKACFLRYLEVLNPELSVVTQPKELSYKKLL